MGYKNSNNHEFRCERKFLVAELTKHDAELVIKHNPAMFSEIFHERAVNNIYFDSLDMESYDDNIQGVTPRLKMRIRWYGGMTGTIKNPVLELKGLEGESRSKQSFPLNQFMLNKKFSMQSLMKEVICKSDLPAWLIETVKHKNPSLLNRYKRRYFISADKKYRITLDFDMEFYKILQRDNLFIERVKHSDYVILELKYMKDADPGAAGITNSFPFRLTKSSKYAIGVKSLY